MRKFRSSFANICISLLRCVAGVHDLIRHSCFVEWKSRGRTVAEDSRDANPNNITPIACVKFVSPTPVPPQDANASQYVNLVNCLPVISAALEPEHTGHPEYHAFSIFPPRASLSIFGVEVVGWPVKPKSP